MKETKTLDFILAHYDFVLLDGSILDLLGEVELPKFRIDPLAIKIKRANYERKGNIINSLIEYMKDRSNLYFTSQIFNEIQRGSDHHFRYKGIIRGSWHPIKKENLKLLRLINNLSRLDRRFVDVIQTEGRLISLNRDEQNYYSKFYQDYEYLKVEYKLSDPDFDFLIFGNVLSYKRGTTALLSNDFDLLRAWKRCLGYMGLGPNQFGFFNTENFHDFRKALYYPQSFSKLI